MELYYEMSKEETFDALAKKCASKACKYKLTCEGDVLTVQPRDDKAKLRLKYRGRLKTVEGGCVFEGKLYYDHLSFWLLVAVMLVCAGFGVWMFIEKNVMLTVVYMTCFIILVGVAVRTRQIMHQKVNGFKIFLTRV